MSWARRERRGGERHAPRGVLSRAARRPLEAEPGGCGPGGTRGTREPGRRRAPRGVLARAASTRVRGIARELRAGVSGKSGVSGSGRPGGPRVPSGDCSARPGHGQPRRPRAADTRGLHRGQAQAGVEGITQAGNRGHALARRSVADAGGPPGDNAGGPRSGDAGDLRGAEAGVGSRPGGRRRQAWRG
jgi:hypothetical protein